MDRVVMKVGGSVITDRAADAPTPDRAAMERTAEELASFAGDLVLVHGAGSYGHPVVAATALDTGVETAQDRLDLARVQRLQNELNAQYCEVLQDAGVPAFPVQASAAALMRDGHLETMPTEVVAHLLDRGMVPVLYGVPAVDTVRDVSVLSGDIIAPHVADAVTADMVLHATDVAGVYERADADDVTVLERVEAVDDAVYGESGRVDVSGGMATKVRALCDRRVRGRIFDGTKPGTIEQALQGEPVGTLVAPR